MSTKKVLDNGTTIIVVTSSFFSYVLPSVASLGAGASASVNLTFDQDSVFDWSKTTYYVDLSAAAMTDSSRPIPLITVSLTDTGSGRLLNSNPIPIDSIAGYKAAEPYLLPRVKQWAPNSTIRATFTNYSNATTYTNIFLTLHGVKHYTA